MNDSEHQNPNQNNDGERQPEALDEVILCLRNQAVPPVPAELLEAAPDTGSKIIAQTARSKTLRNIVIALVVAATLLLTVFLRGNRPEPISPDKSITQTGTSPVTVTPIAQLQPYQGLEDELNEMQKEITVLRRRAELLDVYRRTESLLVKN